MQSEREHPHIKRYYPRSHKGNTRHVRGIARHIRRERILHNLKFGTSLRSSKRRKITVETSASPVLSFRDKEHIEKSPHDAPYEMSHDTAHPLHLPTWLGENAADPALSVRVMLRD